MGGWEIVLRYPEPFINPLPITTNISTPVIVGSGNPGDQATLYDGNNVVGTGAINGSGQWSITTSPLAAGIHTLAVRQTDAAGNTSAASAGLSVTVNLPTPPSLVAEGSITLQHGMTAPIPATQLRFDDSVSPHAQETYTIITAPADGTLLKGTSAVLAGGTFTQADVDNGLISYHETASGASSDSFTFIVADAAGNTTTTQQFNIQITPETPAGTTADMILRNLSDGSFQIFDLGGNAILASFPLGAVGLEQQFAGLGNFSGGDTTDMMLRNTTTGAFSVRDISNSQIVGFSNLGAVGLENQVAGFGDFSDNPGEIDMMMRDTNNGAFEIYDIQNNQGTSATALGAVGLQNQVAGFGDFSGNPNETDMMMRNTNTGSFAIYDIQHNQAVGATPLGAVGLENQVVGFGDFSGNPNETDMMLRNTNTGVFEVYDIQHNQAVSAFSLGAVGLENQVAGFGDFSGNPNETDMLLRNTNTGTFEVYDIRHNQAVSASFLSGVGLELQVQGVANLPFGS